MQDQQQHSPSMFQHAETIRNMMVLPALTVMVFFRKRIGYRLLNPLWLIGLGFGMWVISLLSYSPAERYPAAMSWYALCIPVLGFWQRILRWSDFRRGIPRHSYDSGISILQTAKTPRFFRAY